MPKRMHSKQPRRTINKSVQKNPNAIEKSANLLSELETAEDVADIENSIAVARQIVSSNGSLQALDEAFEVLSSAGESSLAENALKLALAKDSASVDAAYRLLALFGINGDPEILEKCVNLFLEFKSDKEHENSIVYALGRLVEYFLSTCEQADAEKALGLLEELDSSELIFSIEQCAYYLVAENFASLKQSCEMVWNLFLQHNILFQTEDGSFEPGDVLSSPEEPFLIGYCRALTGIDEFDKAELICELCLEQSENDPIILHEMAWIANLKGDYEEAKILLEKALEGFSEQGATNMCEDIVEKLKMFDGMEE